MTPVPRLIRIASVAWTTSGREIGLRSASHDPGRVRRRMSSQDHRQLGIGLAELSEQQRTVAALRDVHGLTSHEVCSFLGLSASNQRVLLHRGRSRLRSRLEMRYAAEAGVMGT